MDTLIEVVYNYQCLTKTGEFSHIFREQEGVQDFPGVAPTLKMVWIAPKKIVQENQDRRNFSPAETDHFSQNIYR